MAAKEIVFSSQARQEIAFAMDETAGIGVRGDGLSKRLGGTKPPGKKRFVDRLLIKGHQTNTDLGMGIVKTAAEKPFLMSIYINEIPGGRGAEYLGHIAVKDPEVAIVSWCVTLGGQTDFRSGTGQRLCHGLFVYLVKGCVIQRNLRHANGSRGCLKSRREATGCDVRMRA